VTLQDNILVVVQLLCSRCQASTSSRWCSCLFVS